MTEQEMEEFQAAENRRYAMMAQGYTSAQKAAMDAFIAKNAQKWALPTTGNLSHDDYRRSREAFGKAALGGITGYTPTTSGTGWGESYSGDIPGQAIYGNKVGDQDLWDQDWINSLSPQQQAERAYLADAHSDKIKGRMQLAALAAFGGIAGAGMLGAGMLGSGAIGGGGGIGALGGAEGLAAADIAGGLIPAFGTEAGYAAGLGGLAGAGGAGLGGAELAGIAGNNISAWLPAGSEALGAGAASVPAWALPGGASAAELAAMGLGGSGGGSSWLQQLGSLLGGGGGTGGGTSGLGSLLGGSGTNWLNLLGNLGGGYLQSQAAGNATDAQLQAARESNALLEKMWQQGRTDQAPYREAGTSALAGIQALLKDPSSITTMPDYQFGFDQGSKALQNSATARGTTYSGQQAKALQRYGNDYAGTKLNESYNRLAGIAGIGQQATNQTGAQGQGYAGQMANNISSAGDSRAAGYIGRGNAWNDAIGGALNGFSEQDLINAWLKRGGG